jgi:GMP synthase (glutamine-hydrolysing)
MRRVLVLQAGSVDSRVAAQFGDFPDWFARLLVPWVEVKVVRPYAEPLPASTSFDGVLMTGSLNSVTESAPWMLESGAYMVEAARTRPVLGVCFGHQLLGQALGGRVEQNPLGREAGTALVELTDAGARDPLFAGLHRRVEVQETHEDHVPTLPPGATLLATNSFSPVQAFAVGDGLRAVQFHPEIDADRLRAMNELRRDLLDRQAPGGADSVLRSIRPAPDCERVLVNWVRNFVGA